MQTNCTAIAKLKINKKLNTYRIVFSFDRFNKLTVKNIVLATGDICDIEHENAEYFITKELQKAKETLRCNNIEFVE